MFYVQDFGPVNLLANLLLLAGFMVGLLILLQMRRMTARIESVIAPKAGIESYLNMCAQVVESDPDGTCIVQDGEAGEIVMVNKSFEDLSGYHRSELVGKSVEMLVPDAMRGAHAAHRDGFTMAPSSRPMRGLKLRHKRGREIPVGIHLGHYTDPSGGFTIAKIRVLQV